MATHSVNSVKIQTRRDTAQGWATANPKLLAGEVGYETDTRKAKVGDGSTTWNNLPYSISPYIKDGEPFATKTYSDLYANPNSFAGGTFYFAKVIPTDYYKPWAAKYRVTVTVPNQTNYSGVYTIRVGGCQSDYRLSKVYNNFFSTSYRPIYNHVLYRATQAGATTYGHLLGERIYSATNGNSASYKRTFIVELLSQENCTVTLFDNAVLYENALGTGSTNYVGYSEMVGSEVGCRTYGDQDHYERLFYTNYRAIAGTNGIKQYSLVMEDANGNFQSLTTTNGTGTTKTKNTVGFKLGKVYYASTSANYTSGQSAGNVLYDAQPSFDFRYSTNCGTTLTADKPVYIKGTISSDGLFYLADTWWTQTLPSSDDGFVYIDIGRAYSTYQVTKTIKNPIWWYKDGAIREYAYSSATTAITTQEIDALFVTQQV